MLSFIFQMLLNFLVKGFNFFWLLLLLSFGTLPSFWCGGIPPLFPNGKVLAQVHGPLLWYFTLLRSR